MLIANPVSLIDPSFLPGHEGWKGLQVTTGGVQHVLTIIVIFFVQEVVPSLIVTS